MNIYLERNCLAQRSLDLTLIETLDQSEVAVFIIMENTTNITVSWSESPNILTTNYVIMIVRKVNKSFDLL